MLKKIKFKQNDSTKYKTNSKVKSEVKTQIKQRFYKCILYPSLCVFLLSSPVMAQKNMPNEGVIQLINQMNMAEQSIRELRGTVEILQNDNLNLKNELDQLKNTIETIKQANNQANKQSMQSQSNNISQDEITLNDANKTNAQASQSNEATKIDPKKNTPQNDAATNLFNAAKDAFDEDLNDESKTAFEQYIALFSNTPKAIDAKFYLAKIATKQDKISIAIEYLQSISVNASKSNPLMPEALSNLATLYKKIGKTKDSQLIQERIQNEYPDSPQSLKINLGAYY